MVSLLVFLLHYHLKPPVTRQRNPKTGLCLWWCYFKSSGCHWRMNLFYKLMLMYSPLLWVSVRMRQTRDIFPERCPMSDACTLSENNLSSWCGSFPSHWVSDMSPFSPSHTPLYFTIPPPLPPPQGNIWTDLWSESASFTKGVFCCFEVVIPMGNL